MRFQVLGGHQVESREGRPISFLIDGRIALDAGGLAGSLSLAEQNQIESVLITHYHYDHIRDLPFVGLAALDNDRQIHVYCSQLVKDTLQQHLLNNVVWLDFFAGLNPDAPTFVHHRVEPGRVFKIGPYDVLPLDNRHHAVPVIGYQFSTPDGRRLAYTGDTGPGIRDLWGLIDPDVLITEVTWPNHLHHLVPKAGHLTPDLLELELVALRELRGELPRILVCHINQAHDAEVAAEIAAVAQRLQAPIELAREGTLIDL